jgi:hypothetical protein
MGSDMADPVRQGRRTGAIRDDFMACQTDPIPLALDQPRPHVIAERWVVERITHPVFCIHHLRNSVRGYPASFQPVC